MDTSCLSPSTLCPGARWAALSKDIQDLSCPLCVNVLYEPVKYRDMYYCRRCLITLSATATINPITSEAIDRESCQRACTVVDDEKVLQVDTRFPMYALLRDRLQGASEKRWWFDLHEKRTNLQVLREKLVTARKDKMSALQALKDSFCGFVKSCKKETAFKKEFEKEHAQLTKRTECAKTSVPLTKERCEAFAALPGRCCCLRALLGILENALLKGPDHLASSHDTLKNVFLGNETFPPCPECGDNILKREANVVGCEATVRDEISKLTDKFDEMFFQRTDASSVNECPMVPVSESVPSLQVECPLPPPKEDKYGLTPETILVTCAKLFGSNGEAEAHAALETLVQTTSDCGADSDDDFLECCKSDDD